MNILIFTVAGKEYGMDIMQVRQVLRKEGVFPVPHAPDLVEGVIALLGEVIPVVSLRCKLGLEKAPHAQTNRIIVIGTQEPCAGISVDSVVEVFSVHDVAIAVPDETLQDALYLIGMAKEGERVIPVLDAEKVLNSEDKDNMQKIQERIVLKRKNG